MKKALILLIPLALGGCANLQTEFAKFGQAFTVATSATVPANVAQVTANSFDVLEAGATQYLRYCKGSPADPRCSADTRRKVIKYTRTGRAARNQIEAAGRSGNLISTTLYNVLVDSVNSLSTSPASSFGVSK